MKITHTHIPDLVVLQPRVFEDNRGFFYESYNKQSLIAAGIDIEFIQDNHSASQYGVLRGLHYQLNPYAQTKLVRVIKGSVFDIAVDMRKGSPTFGEHFGIELSDVNRTQLLIPQGFAHGFVVLSEEVEFLYKCDNYYNKESEGGIRFDDSTLNINWGIPKEDVILSEKDALLPSFENAVFNFTYQ